MNARYIAALLAATALIQPAQAANRRPAVVIGGQVSQLPLGATLEVNPSGTGGAAVNIPPGVAPTAPVSGDCWTTTADLFCQLGGTIVAMGSAASGTVTSVSVSGGSTGLSTSGGPVTSAGTITVGGVLNVASGGTGASTAGGARINLGLGTIATAASGDYLTPSGAAASYQPLATVLTDTTASFTTAQASKLSGIATGATVNSADATLLARANHTGTQTASTISDFTTSVDARLTTLQPLDAQLTDLAALTYASNGLRVLRVNSAATGWELAAASTGDVVAANNLSDLTNPATARSNLGLGTLATQSGTFSGTSSGTNTGDQNLAGYLTTASAASTYQPLDSDLTAVAALATTTFGRSRLTEVDASAARTAIGLGTLATQSGTFSGTSSGSNTGDQDLSGYATTSALTSGYQPLDGDLTSIAGLAGTSGFAKKTAANTWTLDASSYLTANQTVTLTGDTTGSGATSIATTTGRINGVALSGLATGILRNTTSTGVPSIAVAGDFPTLNQSTTGSAASLTTGRTIAMTGDVSWTSPAFDGTGGVTAAGTIQAGVVTLSKLANVATGTIRGRTTAGTGSPEDLTGTQATALLDVASGTAKGLMSSGDFTKLGGIATGATANSSDATLLARANHTGTQAPATILTSAGSVLVGRYAATGGAGQEVTVGTGLALNTSTGVLSNTVTDTNSGGTVTAVSVATANGVSGTSSGGATPALTIALGAVTPSSVAASGTVTGSNLTGTHAGSSSGTNTGDQTITLSGDVTGSGTGSFATAIGANKVTLGMLAQVATATFRGRSTAGTGSPEDLTVAQAKTLLNLAGSNTGDQDLSTYAPLASPTFTGTVTLPAATVTLAQQASVATSTVFYRKTVATGAPEVQTLATLKTDLGLTGTNSGDQTTVSGNAGTATALATGRTIAQTGDVTWTSPAFDGTANVTAAATVTRVNGTSLAGLATGILRNTTTTGVPVIAVAADFPTLNQSTTGSAATLTTGRTIAMTGDVAWTSPSFDGSANVTAAGTLATVNATTGAFGSATQVGTFTVNGKGLITTAANATITPAVGSITGLGTGVATALAVAVGSAGAPVTFNGALGTPSSGTLTNATGLPEAGVTNLVSDLALKAPLASPTFTGTVTIPTPTAGDSTTKAASTAFVATSFAPIASPVFTGTMYWQQGAPTALTATGTLTIANITTGIITVTSATAVSLTLPTGTLSDAGILAGALASDRAFEWYTINLGSSTGAVTMVAGTAHTIVGSVTCAIGTTCHWGTRKTATNTFVTYRLN